MYRAYLLEKTRFVRSSYLTALKALDVSEYIDSLQERYEELLAYEPQEEERKHVTEERGLLQQLLAQSGVLKKHTFTGWKRRNDVIFTTERPLRSWQRRYYRLIWSSFWRTAIGRRRPSIFVWSCAEFQILQKKEGLPKSWRRS